MKLGLKTKLFPKGGKRLMVVNHKWRVKFCIWFFFFFFSVNSLVTAYWITEVQAGRNLWKSPGSTFLLQQGWGQCCSRSPVPFLCHVLTSSKNRDCTTAQGSLFPCCCCQVVLLGSEQQHCRELPGQEPILHFQYHSLRAWKYFEKNSYCFSA